MLKNIMTVTLEGAIAIVYFATDGDTAGAVPIPTVTDTCIQEDIATDR